MPTWIEIGTKADYPPGSKSCLKAGNREIVVCNVEGDLCVVSNTCPHAGLPLGEGDLVGKVLTCPFHGYAYDVRTGKNVDFEDDVPLNQFPVRVENDKLLVDIEHAGA